MKSRTIIFIIAFMFSILAIAAGRELKYSKDEKTVYLINKSKYGYENMAVVKGAKSAAKEYGVDLQVLAPDSESDIKTQKILLEEAFSNRPDGIIVCPIDTVAITKTLSEINKLDTEVILINNVPSLSGGFKRIGYNDMFLGAKIGQDWISRLEDKPVINVYRSREGFRETKLILDGLNSIFANNVEYNIYDDMSSEEHMYSAVVEKHIKDGVSLAICLDEPSLLGLAKCKDILEEIPVVGINSSLEILENIDNENIDKIYILNYFDYGYSSVLNLISKDEKIDKKDELIIVDKDNIFDENIEKLVFPLY